MAASQPQVSAAADTRYLMPSFGARADGDASAKKPDGSPATDDTQAVQTAWRSVCASPANALDMAPSGISVGQTFYRVTDTITIDGLYGSGLIRGRAQGHGQVFNGAVLVWDRPGTQAEADRPMIKAGCHTTIFQGIKFACAPGRYLQQYVDIAQSGPASCTRNTFLDCHFDGASGRVRDGITVDYYQTSVNCEDMIVSHCSLYDFSRYYINVVGAQPYNFLVEKCFILNSNNAEMTGVGLFSIATSFSGIARNTFFYNLEAMTGGINQWSLDECDSEKCKRMYDGEGFTGEGRPIRVTGGRHFLDTVDRPSHGPRVIPATDMRYVVQGGPGPVTLTSVNFEAGARDIPGFEVAMANPSAPLTSIGCRYPTSSPFSRGGVRGGSGVGKTTSLGDIHQGSTACHPLPILLGV